MIFASLASGSSGNCTFLSCDTANILIDCGISAKKIDESLRALGFSADGLDAVFLTHEHTDHIKGLKRLMSAYGIPVFASAGTLSALSAALKDEYFSFAGKSLMYELQADRPVHIRGMQITPFRISHDAAQPFAYRIDAAEALSLFTEEMGDDGCHTVHAAVATDMGYFDDEIRDHLMGLDALLIEANHDRGMLANGPYPLRLKRRIMSREGHLSNVSCGQLLSEIMHPGLKYVLLGHLSKENNTPEAAFETVTGELCSLLHAKKEELPHISVAPPDRPSEVFEL
ncbi:MAG: MBL fold metallo-hydrolase [Eubacteriales bacterium]|nr:MBL fold metallo-hydrolase [Eubacteriales bacterium]